MLSFRLHIVRHFTSVVQIVIRLLRNTQVFNSEDLNSRPLFGFKIDHRLAHYIPSPHTLLQISHIADIY